MIIQIVLAAHIALGLVSFILERDILRNTLIIKKKDTLWLSEDEYKPSRRNFTSLFKLSDIKNGFCVGRHKYSLMVLMERFLFGVLFGAIAFFVSLMKVMAIGSNRNLIITDSFNVAVDFFGRKAMGHLNSKKEMKCDMLYIVDGSVRFYTKSSIIRKLYNLTSNVRCGSEYLKEKMSNISYLLNKQR